MLHCVKGILYSKIIRIHFSCLIIFNFTTAFAQSDDKINQNGDIVVVGGKVDNIISVIGKKTIASDEIRLKTVGYHLSVSNVASCEHKVMQTGLVVHDLSYYNQNDQLKMREDYDLSSGFIIISVVKRSASFRDGFKGGDQIMQINGINIFNLFPIVHHNKYNLYRTVAFEIYLAEALDAGRVVLTIQRSGEIFDLPIRGEPGCGGLIRMELNNDYGPDLDLKRNAWYDGINTGISRRLVEFTMSDDELAFVVAHEMSHNILGHFGIRYKGLFGFQRPASQGENLRMEAVTDEYAIQMLSNTLYDPRASVGFLQRSKQEPWMQQSNLHPDALDRVSIVNAEMKNIGESQFMRSHDVRK